MEPLGINMVKLGLQDVLYDPKTGQIYIPNTNTYTKVGEGGVNEGQELNLGESQETSPLS